MEKLRDGKNNLASFVSYVASFRNVENLAITSNLLVFETGLTEQADLSTLKSLQSWTPDPAASTSPGPRLQACAHLTSLHITFMFRNVSFPRI